MLKTCVKKHALKNTTTLFHPEQYQPCHHYSMLQQRRRALASMEFAVVAQKKNSCTKFWCPEVTPKEITPKEITPKEITPKEITPKEITPKEITPKRKLRPRKLR